MRLFISSNSPTFESAFPSGTSEKEGAAVTSRLFDVRPAALARIPLLPVLAPALAEQPESAGKPEPRGDPVLREAVFLASRQVETGEEGASAGGSRASATLRGYELRARWRPVPNGAFAAAAPARIGSGQAVLRLGAGHRACSVPSGTWLFSVASSLADNPSVLDQVMLTTCDLVTRRGHSFELERPAASGEPGPQRACISATAATELILRVCATGCDGRSLVALARERWPSAPETMVRATIGSLVRQGMILTDLLPDDLWDDPLGHLLRRLPAGLQGREAVVRLRSLLAEADRHHPGDPVRLTALRAAREQADEVCAEHRPLSVNVIADASLVLPRSVADAAADAATLLWRIGEQEDPLADYRRQFTERYGLWRLVPFAELCDPVLGLGTCQEPRDEDGPGRPDREQALARLIARAMTTGSLEVTLDESDIGALASDPGRPPSRTAEIWVRVLAASQADRDAGRFFLAVSGGSQDAGSTSGRFADLRPLLPVGSGQPEQSAADGWLTAELVVRPGAWEVAQLAPPTGLAPWRIPVGVVPREGDLRLADLHVSCDGDRLILWSARHGRPVIPTLYSRLSPDRMPPEARLLQLIGHAGCRPLRGWSWGAMRHHPFQPRIRYQQTVLSPARWLLPPDLVAAARGRARWPRAVKAWQAGTIPSPNDIVVIEDGERLLPLDLRQDDDRELLRRHVGRGTRSVTEQPGGPDAVQAVVAGPEGDHVLELVLSLDRRGPSPAPPAPVASRPAAAGLHLPGGEWLSLALRAPGHLHDQLAMSLGEVAASLPGPVSHWFWLRYADAASGPHLRARFHGDPAVLGGQVLPALSAWCRVAIRQQICGGFSIEPYEQEIERYGGSGAITAAEHVFAADSQLALAIIRTAADPGQRIIAAALAAATTVLTVAPARPAETIGRPRLDRAARTRYDLLRSQARAAWPPFAPDMPMMAAAHPAWRAWQTCLVTYREALGDDAQRARCASSLIHMSANRLLGNPGDEKVARALAADIIARAASGATKVTDGAEGPLVQLG